MYPLDAGRGLDRWLTNQAAHPRISAALPVQTGQCIQIVSGIDLDDVSHDLSLLSSCWILRVVGCDLEGNLIDLTWYMLAIISVFVQKAQN